jgi:hypothetical protein
MSAAPTYSSFPHGTFKCEEDYIGAPSGSTLDFYDFERFSSQDGLLFARTDNPFFIMNEPAVYFFTKFKSLKNLLPLN